MRTTTTLITATILLVSATALPALAHQGETRELDADASGTATNVQTGETADATVNLTGPVEVMESGEGVDRTAHTHGPEVTADVSVGDETFEIPVTVGGEGTSLVQTGVAADAWRLNAQGSAFPTGEDAQDNQGDPDPVATFHGNLTMIGAEGGYDLQGNGTLTVFEDDGASTYELSYTGEATFE